MQRKAVFFDIDGTLWDEDFVIPDSTSKAIQKLRENGHYAFICSGRSRAFIIGENLFAVGFDGIVAGCGTMVEVNGEVPFYHRLDEKLVRRVAYLMRENQIPVIMEGRYYLYADMGPFKDDPFAIRVKENIGKGLLDLESHLDDMEVSKFSISMPNDNYLKVMPELEEYFTPLEHEDRCIEFVPKGFSKATGIAKTCELLGIRQEDTYAFGDSVNDVDMLKYVAHGIVMGNGTPVAKEAGDYITTPLHEDGIYNGLKHFELIS